MPRITKILPKPEKERVWIFVDYEYCTSVRERTFSGLGLFVGQTISCEQIKELESHHWKHTYGQAAWDKEKVRLEKVRNLILSIDDRISVDITGFGANTNEFIAGHPDEAGKPDLEIRMAHNGATILWLEVTGTEFMRGETYWVRPDKLEYAKNHPELDVWLALHFASPEKFVFIKPNPNTNYAPVLEKIRQSGEWMVHFDDNHADVIPVQDFVQHLKNKINASIVG